MLELTLHLRLTQKASQQIGVVEAVGAQLLHGDAAADATIANAAHLAHSAAANQILGAIAFAPQREAGG
jgi:hypothetical protein